MTRSATEIAKKLHYKIFKAPKGYGQPQRAEELNELYSSGHWDFLDSIHEMTNYAVTAGYIRFLSNSLSRKPRILDLGCGSGNLVEFLSGTRYEKFLGLDISPVALEQANLRNFENSTFQLAKFEDWETDEKFDFIVSTGAIHYAESPVKVLLKFKSFLSDQGVFVISLWRYGHNSKIWRNIENHFEVMDSTVVTNHNSQIWDVRVLKAK
jgi:SAM-dependent methyltransferase